MNSLLIKISALPLFRGDFEYNALRAVMVLTFFMFGIQKWSPYTAQMLVPLISHSPIVFWLEPAFGVRGAGYFLGSTELIFGALVLLGYWSHKLGILGRWARSSPL